MKRRLHLLVLAVVAPALTGFDCGDSPGSAKDTASASVAFMNTSGTVTVTVKTEPFALVVQDRAGRVLLESAAVAPEGEPSDPSRSYGALGLTRNEDMSVTALHFGWNYYRGDDDPWHHVVRATGVETKDGRLTAHLETNDPARPGATLTLASSGIGLNLTVTPDDAAGDPSAALNRVSLAFAMHDDDHFFGFGERFVRSDHRGQMLFSWVEDGGFGQGENTPPGPSNPMPSGEGQTNIPIPWFMSPRGFGMLVNSTYRVNYHLGDERTDAWRLEATTGTLNVTVFADPDPLALVQALTDVTGRPPEIADWVLAPRRRANPGTDEAAKLRAAHIPTSVIDSSVHYFPNGVGTELAGPAMKALTGDMHRRGFKAIAYFCPFIADSYHPVFDEAVAKGYVVKKRDGSPYVVLDPPYVAAMVDFTNPAAVTWYQGFLKGALDDGWDGWMYDFAEYLPQDAVMFNGMSGFEAHNLYPVLYQRAAFELLERERKKDYLVFVRSGYVGTAGLVPMVWAGDQNTDFGLADGLPAALTGALNAGMSGLPLWGSDISGYHFLYNAPPDKDLYLRWTELGAFSADMHDENEGTGNGKSSDRWQIWKDQESQDVYRKYASYKTRMLPYVRVAVRQARERGTPIMRHLYLTHPTDARVYGLTDEYMYGDALLVAPVVTRGTKSRTVYLPDAAYFDFWSGVRVKGGGDILADAPLGVVPVFAKMGAIVPMLASDVETVVPSADKSVISMQDRADFLEVMVFAGGESTLTLDDGTLLSQSAPEAPFLPGPATRNGATVPVAATEAELMTCEACVWNDPARHVISIAMHANEGTIVAGAMKVSAVGGERPKGSQVKRYLFTVRF